MKCKLTGIEGKAVKAHIIPKSFYSIDPKEKKPMQILTNSPGQRSERSQIGAYDKTIVTEEGERIFDPLDNYAAKLLLKNREDFLPIGSPPVCLLKKEYDYKLLKQFILSVLWRPRFNHTH